ncbi:MAG: hypothetical protein AAF704_06500 [Cyanobacteria bacterium P01_D01_bin.123]
MISSLKVKMVLVRPILSLSFSGTERQAATSLRIIRRKILRYRNKCISEVREWACPEMWIASESDRVCSEPASGPISEER